MAKSYSEKLLDRRWQKRRLEELERAGWVCEWCGADDHSTLHVHHWVYAKNPWEAPQGTLTVLCEPCHKNGDRLRVAAVGLMGLVLANPNVPAGTGECIERFVGNLEGAIKDKDIPRFFRELILWFDGGGSAWSRSLGQGLAIDKIISATSVLIQIHQEEYGKEGGLFNGFLAGQGLESELGERWDHSVDPWFSKKETQNEVPGF